MYTVQVAKTANSAIVKLVICRHPNTSFRIITMTFTPISGTAKTSTQKLT